MKKAPCARFGIRIKPKINEKPDDSRNSRPPNATLLSVWMIQNCIFGFRLGERSEGCGESGLTRQLILLRQRWTPGSSPGVTRGCADGCERYGSRFFAGG